MAQTESNQELVQAYSQILQDQQTFFHSGEPSSIPFRKKMLQTLYKAIKAYESQIIDALNRDLGKSEFDAYSNEVGIVYTEIGHTIKKVRSWSKPRRLPADIHLLPASSKQVPEAYGTVLILSPWNYPFQLLMAPLVSAIAAGNTAVLKPSELSVNVSAVITKMFDEFFPKEYIQVVNGGVEETTALLDQEFDYIFFTGSTPVGKIVMQAAAKRLIPLTLELGGKSPVIVDETADISGAAKKIVWAKFLNCGQTCVAPDYILVHESRRQKLVEEMKKTITLFYGDDPHKNPHFGRIITQRHCERLVGLMDQNKIVHGGEYDLEERYLAPTLMDEVDWSDKIMEDEIFGPILPILSYRDLNEAIRQVNDRPKPLAAYVFSTNRKNIKAVTRRIRYGGGGINTAVLHVASKHLPFGGVGASGMGSYHGKTGFETFSHLKSLLTQPAKFDPGLAYPHKQISLKLIKTIMK